MDNSFNEKAIWIVGASHGIGRALAISLHKEGARLVLSGRDREVLLELNQQLGSKHLVIALDVSAATSVASAYKAIVTHGVELDSLIYMAGFYEPSAIESVTEQNLVNSLAVNLNGAIFCVQQLLPLYLQRNRGQFVICGSLSAYRGLPKGQPYSATKAALVNFTESLRAEMQDKGIDVRLLSPGYVQTRLTEKNDFKMPDLIKPEQAAEEILKGLRSERYEIRFPKGFARKLKLLKILPDSLYFRLIRRFVSKVEHR